MIFALPIGAALALAFAPFNLWPLAIVCPAWLFYSWQDASPKRAALLGFAFTSGTFLAGTYWLYHSIYIIGQAPLPVAIFLMLALVAIMGAYTALLGYLQARWLPARGPLRLIVALPAAWLLIEWLRGWLFSGFPWLALGYAGIDTPLSALAPIAGIYGVSWMFALLAGAAALSVLALRKRGHEGLQPAAYVVLIVPWLLGFAVWHKEWTRASGEPISVAIVQGAVPQEMKWSPQQRDATLKLYRELTVPHLGTQLIVWPESALPDWAEALAEYLGALWRDANAQGSHLVIGQQHFDVKTDKAYNSVLALGRELQWYHKRHLVPFGEFFPVPKFIREWMRMMSLPHSDFTAGADDQPALDAAGQKIAVTICYEDAYGADQLSVLRDATLIVNVTNDAWFGDSTARHQHLQISRMRALEAGRPLLRAANDGISAIIDARGNVVQQLPSFQSAVLTGSVQPRAGLTPYAKAGNWPIIGLSVVLLGFALAGHRKRAAHATP